MLIYLASPYSHANPVVRQARFAEICRVAARLMHDGAHIFSPIAHSHPIALAGDLPLEFEYWEQYDRKMLAACAELWVCMMDGWRESKGVTEEIAIATELKLPIRYIPP